LQASTFGKLLHQYSRHTLEVRAPVWWDLVVLYLILQVPLGILVGFWISDPTDDEKEIPDPETLERDTSREPLFVSSGKGAEQ
jgi:hypothetical protein